MAYLDHNEAFEDFKNRTLEGIQAHFPVEGRDRSLVLKKLEVDEALASSDDLDAQHAAKVGGHTFSRPIYATVGMRDKTTGKESVERLKVGELPVMTRRYSYIIGGQEYQVDNQWQLKPGVYTQRKADGALKTEFNIPNKPSFSMRFNPEKKQFMVERGSSKDIPAYPILKAMGVDDDTLERTWGKDVLQINKEARGAGTALERFYKADKKNAPSSPDAAASYVRQTLLASQLRPEAVERTLGKKFDAVEGGTLVLATKRLLDVHGGAPQDDRDSLVFKDLRSVGDYAFDKLTDWKTVRAVRTKMQRQLNSGKALSPRDVLRTAAFSRPIMSTFTQNSAARPADQINPVEMLSSAMQTTVMGPGGIKSEYGIQPEVKYINPSHFGFLDPLHTPEGSRTGVSLHLPMGVKKVGRDPKIPVYNLQTGKKEMLGPAEFVGSSVLLPDQVRWDDKGRPTPVGARVKASGVNNEIEEIDAKKAKYTMYHPSQAFSLTSNLIPFMGNTSGNRASYATHHLEQAISLADRDEPLIQIGTGAGRKGLQSFEAFLGRQSAHVSPVSGTVVRADKQGGVVIKDASGKEHKVALYNNFPLNDAKAVLDSTPIVKAGDKVSSGQVVGDTNFTKGGTLALGKNLRVAYIPYKGYNFEDGVVLSESGAQALKSIHMHKPSVRLQEGDITATAKFQAEHAEAFKKQQFEKLDANGIIRVGQRVGPGDPLVLAARKVTITDQSGIARVRKSLSGRQTDASLRWEKDHVGEVVGVHKSPKGEITVHVKTVEPMTVGDKLTGRHGNKGIVTRILADDEMPRTKDGQHVQVALNPAGVPGRVNVGQVLETALSKVARKTGKPLVVNNFEFGVDQIEYVKKELKKHGLEDQEELIDPKTGQSLGRALVGEQHMLKLQHQVDKKVSVRSGMRLRGEDAESYDTNLIPKGGGKAGAQSIGNLGMNVMLAHGALANIREMQTWKSEGEDRAPEAKRWKSQHDDVWNAIQVGAALPAPKPTFAFQKFTDMLRASGINVEKKGHKLQLSPLTDAEIERMSSGELSDPSRLTYAKVDKSGELKPMSGGLFDERKTGGIHGKKWSHFSLAEPMPNPIFEEPIKKILGLTKNEFVDVVNGDKAIDPKTAKVVPLGKGVSGGPGIAAALQELDVEKTLAAANRDLEEVKISPQFAHGANTQKLDVALKKVKYLNVLKEKGLTAKDAYVLTKMPVLPPAMRHPSILNDGSVRWDDLNGLYKGVAEVNGQMRTLKALSGVGIGDQDLKESRRGLYDGMRALVGVGQSATERDAPKGVLQLIHGSSPKEGFFQKTLLSRKQDMTMRSTIVPEPDMGLDDVGVPAEKALTLFRPFVIKKMVDMGVATTPLQAQELLRDKKAHKDTGIFKALSAVMEERPVLMKRDPALHKHSIQAFTARPVKGSAIKIHPLVVNGYNADFDGDSALGHILIVSSTEMRDKDSERESMPHLGKLFSYRSVDLAEFPRIESSARTTERGVIKYDVPEGVCVPSFHTAGFSIMQPVTEYSVHPNCEEWKVQTERGRELTVSSDHSLALLNPETLSVEKATPRDAEGCWLPTLRMLHENHNPVRYLVGASPKHKRAGRMLEQVPATHDVGWFIGASIGDGWVSGPKNARHHGVNGPSQSERRQAHLAYGHAGAAVTERWCAWGKWIAQNANHGVVTSPHEFRGFACESSRATISSTALGLWLEALIGKGARSKRLPEGFLYYPLEFRQGLFCGLMDTDGTSNWSKGVEGGKKPQYSLSLTTVSQPLVDGVVALALSLGLVPSVTDTSTPQGEPAWLIAFSIRTVQEAEWLRFTYPEKAEALQKLREQERVGHGRADRVPLPEWARQELLGHLRKLGASRKGVNRDKASFSQYVVLQRETHGLTRVSVEALQKLLQPNLFSERLTRWFELVSNQEVGWDYVTSASPTGEVKTMYDITVPGTWTFTMSDGAVVWDTMSLYVPISEEAVTEARGMMPSNNLFNEATGQVTYAPTLESSLGLYRMTQVSGESKKRFKTAGDAMKAVQAGTLKIDEVANIPGYGKTTVGRVLLADALPTPMKDKVLKDHTFVLNKNGVSSLFSDLAKNHKEEFAASANKLKDFGFDASYGAIRLKHPELHRGQGGIDAAEKGQVQVLPIGTHSLSLADLTPDKKVRDTIVKATQRRVDGINKSALTKEQKEGRVVEEWSKATVDMQKAHLAGARLAPDNLYRMFDAGIKPGMSQYQQLKLAPMLLEDASGRTIPIPVTKSYSEGLDMAGYWIQSSGARKGSIQKVQEVRDPGYFSKQLVNTAMNMQVTSEDCGTSRGIGIPIGSDDVNDRELVDDLKVRGRTFAKGTILSPEVVGQIRRLDKGAQVVVRSSLKCAHGKGVCQKCAGISPNGSYYDKGSNLGILSAQSLGERSVQVALKSFHSGGIKATGGPGILGAFQRTQQLTLLPKNIPNAATLAMSSGTVERVEEDTTGTNVWVGGKKHFIPKDAQGRSLAAPISGVTPVTWVPPKVGAHVDAGQSLSDTGRSFVNPRDLYKATGNIDKVQNYLTSELHSIYGGSKGEGVRRQHVETVVKSMTNLARVKHSGDAQGILKGEYQPLSQLRALNSQLLKEGKRPIKYAPVLKGVDVAPLSVHDDWMAKLNYARLTQTLTDAAAEGSLSDLHGLHPIPGVAYGADLGMAKKKHRFAKPELAHLPEWSY